MRALRPRGQVYPSSRVPEWSAPREARDLQGPLHVLVAFLLHAHRNVAAIGRTPEARDARRILFLRLEDYGVHITQRRFDGRLTVAAELVLAHAVLVDELHGRRGSSCEQLDHEGELHRAIVLHPWGERQVDLDPLIIARDPVRLPVVVELDALAAIAAA